MPEAEQDIDLPAETPIQRGLWALAALTFLVLGPVLVPLGAVWAILDARRMRKVADQSTCEACGLLLTAAAVNRAMQAKRKRIAEWSAQSGHLGTLPNFRPVDAVCGHCGACHVHVQAERRFARHPPAACSPEGSDPTAGEATP